MINTALQLEHQILRRSDTDNKNEYQHTEHPEYRKWITGVYCQLFGVLAVLLGADVDDTLLEWYFVECCAAEQCSLENLDWLFVLGDEAGGAG